ncbi:MAG: anthranilate phosphoribosyltransferase [Limisphaerales bacterium]
MLQQLTKQVQGGAGLSADEVATAIEGLVAEAASLDDKAAFLAALAGKGETIEEIAAFARELKRRAIAVPISDSVRHGEVLDIVGTGGDRLGTFNISTAAAVIAAAAGVNVAKHGNRAVTSKTGSADVIEALGIPLDLTPTQAARCLAERGFVFLFAQRYHPAFKHLAPARRLCAERGQRTIFNFLGPLLNPANPSAMLVGVPRPELCEPLAHVLQELGVRRAMVVAGKVHLAPEAASDYVDEFSTLGPTVMAEFYHDRGFHASTFNPWQLPLHTAVLDDLRGGDREVNAAIVRAVLGGEDHGPKRDAVRLNAGVALFVAGAVRSIDDGWELAGAVIDDGRAARKLAELARPFPG